MITESSNIVSISFSVVSLTRSPFARIALSSSPIISPLRKSKPSTWVSRTAYVTCPERTDLMASSIACLFSSTDASGLNAIAAEIPSGTLLVGMTTKFLLVTSPACSAAKTIFLLLGKTKTVRAGTLSAAFAISSALGFIVCPPTIISSTVKSLKMEASPSPGATEIIPISLLSSTACAFFLSSLFCSRIFSILRLYSSPSSSA